MTPKTLAQEYKLEEMKLLRGEVELRGQERRSMERYVLLADAAIYSFVLAPGKTDAVLTWLPAPPVPADGVAHELAGLAWYLPPMLAFLALIRWRESLKMIDCLARYIKSLEGDFLGKKGGWEQSLADMRGNSDVAMVSVWYLVFWGILIGGTLGLAWYAAPLYPLGHRLNRSLWIGAIAGALSSLLISWPWLRATVRKRAGPARWPRP